MASLQLPEKLRCAFCVEIAKHKKTRKANEIFMQHLMHLMLTLLNFFFYLVTQTGYSSISQRLQNQPYLRMKIDMVFKMAQ